MSKKTLEHDVMARYLLGQLPEAEQEAFEEKLFVDDDCLDQLAVFEMELIDNYVQGKMSAAQRAEFERGFLTTPDRAKKVANAKALMRHVIELKPAIPVIVPETSPSFWTSLASYLSFQSPAMQYAAVAAIVVLTIGGLWLLYDGARLRRELHEAQNQRATEDKKIQEERAALQRELELKRKELQQLSDESAGKVQDIERLKGEIAALENRRDSLNGSQQGEQVTAFLKLSPPTRGPETVTIRLPEKARRLNLQVEVSPPTARSYTASINASGGKLLRVWRGLKPRQNQGVHFVSLNVPTDFLTNGTYVVSAIPTSAEAKRADYQIKVIKEIK